MTPASKKIATIAGPTLMAVAATEAANIEVFAAQIAPVVYLNGTLLFVAGLSIVSNHNRWVADWTVLVTLTGWAALVLGLLRMTFPASPQAEGGLLTYLTLSALFLVGCVLTAGAFLIDRRR